jgi:hypothetical protein
VQTFLIVARGEIEPNAFSSLEICKEKKSASPYAAWMTETSLQRFAIFLPTCIRENFKRPIPAPIPVL